MPAPLNNLSHIEHQHLLTIVQESLRVRRRVDFFLWMNGDLQRYLPNEIVVAGWGDFDLGPMYLEVISADPGVRGSRIDHGSLAPLVKKLFARWVENNCSSYMLKSGDSGFTLASDPLDAAPDCGLARGLRQMRSAIVHGIRNQRGNYDSLYIVFNSKRMLPRETRSVFEVLLPYMDASLRQVPIQQELHELIDQTHPVIDANDTETPGLIAETAGLTGRESEVMEWVKKGKTNHEIATILGISVFTVKNHLAKIFRKLDVLNRAQAVASVSRAVNG